MKFVIELDTDNETEASWAFQAVAEHLRKRGDDGARLVAVDEGWSNRTLAHYRTEPGRPVSEYSGRTQVAPPMTLKRKRCVVCGVVVRQRAFDGVEGVEVYLDPDGMPSSESPRFHDHDVS